MVIRATGTPQNRSTVDGRECAGCRADLAGACLLVGARLEGGASYVSQPETEPGWPAAKLDIPTADPAAPHGGRACRADRCAGGCAGR